MRAASEACSPSSLDEWSAAGLADAPPLARTRTWAGPGLRVAQVVLQGRIDAGLRAAGAGDGAARHPRRPPLEGAWPTGRDRPRRHRHARLRRRARGGVSRAPMRADRRALDDPPRRLRPRPVSRDGEMWPHRREAERALELTPGACSPWTSSICASPTSARSPPRASASGSASPCASPSRRIRTSSSGTPSGRGG